MADEEGKEKPLNDEERRQIREIIESDQRAKWLWSSIRVWSLWIAALITGLSMTWDTIVAVIKAAVSK